MVLDAGTLRFMGDWSSRLASEWRLEVPLKIHTSSRIYSVDGTPEWTPEFTRWIERHRSDSEVRDTSGPYENAPARIRTTKAMRKLRKAAPHEFNAVYDAVVLHPIQAGTNMKTAIAEITARLNERAIRKGYPERFTPRDVEVLLFSGIEKLLHWR